MTALVGYTGFVGSNIAAGGQIEGLYNTKNIQEAFGTRPDLLIYAGLRAEKFLAEKFPEEDLKQIETAKENIRKIDPEKLVLISTIDVYEDSFHATEKTPAEGAGAYGKHRANLELWVRKEYPDALVVRLPGLFGKGIKKNFIYDYIHFLPALLNEKKFAELSGKAPELKEYYALNDRGFFQLREVNSTERGLLRGLFEKLGFSALNFTDSRGIFQYYCLENIYRDIFTALDNNIRILNITSEPVSIFEIYKYLTGKDFVNETSDRPPCYDARTIHYHMFGGFPAEDGIGGYMYSKEEVLHEIKLFAEKETHE